MVPFSSTHSGDKKGCEALIIHFCFPCPISGLFFVLLPLIDRGRGFQRGRSIWEEGRTGEEGEKIRMGNWRLCIEFKRFWNASYRGFLLENIAYRDRLKLVLQITWMLHCRLHIQEQKQEFNHRGKISFHTLRVRNRNGRNRMGGRARLGGWGWAK